MVFFITGVTGSGKTYFLVNYAESKINDVVHNISGYKNGFYVDFGLGLSTKNHKTK